MIVPRCEMVGARHAVPLRTGNDRATYCVTPASSEYEPSLFQTYQT
jgi:hypothetical protein